jgi:hypothetical protein
MTGDCKNPLLPQPSSHSRDGVREGRVRLADPIDQSRAAVASRHLGVQRRHDRIQTEQTRGYAQNGFFLSTPSRFQPKVGSHFLEGRFDRPSTGKVFDHLSRSEADVGREEVIVAVRTGAVVDEHPQDCDQAFALFVPMARAGDDFDVSSATTVPSHVQPLPLLRPCHDSFGRWQFLPLEAWSSNPRLARAGGGA